jgi:hypothetical protein
MAYATPTNLLSYIDARLIGDLALDTGVRLTPTQILTDPNVAAALSSGAGEINSCVLVGQRYTVAQLNALTGDDAALLQMLNSWLAYGILCSRRGRDPKERPEYVQTQETLKQISQGAELFNTPQGQSGLPQTNFMTAAQWQSVNTIRSATPQLFPVRRQQQAVGGN